MKCTKCNNDTQVTDSRSDAGGTQTRRRRKCLKCEHSFSTYERRNDDASEQKLTLLLSSLASITKEIELVKHKMQRVQNSKKTKKDNNSWKV